MNAATDVEGDDSSLAWRKDDGALSNRFKTAIDMASEGEPL